ncbi:MAG: helicase-related protein [Anaerolineales bacterium]|nr:helicase-related protein [Anaerolineales bacterium]
MPSSKPISPLQPSLPDVPSSQTGKSKKPAPERSGDLFIVDNSDEQWKVLRYLREWCEISTALDVASGYFEIGALLALDGKWQNLDRIRILMGDEASKRTHEVFVQALGGLKKKLDDSIETEKEKNDFLTGVPAIVQALQSGKIACRVYRERKFHAKAYITYPRLEVVGAAALVGSSNFTLPGLTENIELNVRIRHDVEELQAWYEQYWNEAEDVTPEILQVIERHTREFSPFEVYARALYEFFEGHEMSASEWEREQSVMFRVLDHYQKEGYYDLLDKARDFNGALLCDSVGLGKTFIGLMLIERLLHDRKRVALFVPKAAREAVWEAKLNKYLPGVVDSRFGNNFVIYNHTDLLRESQDYPRRMQEVAEKADVVLIDEAHHFRNQAARSYRKLFEMLAGKQVFLLTATPINNSSLDLQHLIELFSRRRPDHFRSIGIHSLPGHFRTLEKALQKAAGDGSVEISAAEAERLLSQDELFRAVVVQRSRAYARRSQEQHGGAQVIFPQRQPPRVAAYSLQKTYGGLLEELKRAFSKEKPLLSLAVYYPLNYPVRQMTLDSKSGLDYEFEKGRQEQVVGLIRTQLLKRFESSAYAFRATCEDLLLKLLAWVEVHSETPAETRRLERWKAQHEELLIEINRRKQEESGEEELEDDASLPLDLLEKVEKLSRKQYRVEEILNETYLDLEQLVTFLREIRHFSAASDDKVQTLIALLQNDDLLRRHKVLIFSEYRDTARYLYRTLQQAGFTHIAEVDSGRGGDRGEIITAFSPYYNESSSGDLAAQGRPETRILISTDVLSEGLNLQDACLLINYDLHWNPVRLMQRIGRVDRRLDPDIEQKLLADHPEARELRGKVYFWNFLPPNELDDVLRLYERVAHKTLRISKLFGIEGRQLLTPEDDYEALKEFGRAYEGQMNPLEEMRAAFNDLLQANPGLEERLRAMPLRVFSGRTHPSAGAQAVFFCYRVPGPDASGVWSLEAGSTKWLLYDLARQTIEESPERIYPLIRSTPETPRRLVLPRESLVEIRRKVEEHLRDAHLKKLQAPAGQKPLLKAWMELN